MPGAIRALGAPLVAAAVLVAAAPSEAASAITIIPGVSPQAAAPAATPAEDAVAFADPAPRRRDLGGGFIEFVLTGRTDGARRAAIAWRRPT